MVDFRLTDIPTLCEIENYIRDEIGGAEADGYKRALRGCLNILNDIKRPYKPDVHPDWDEALNEVILLIKRDL